MRKHKFVDDANANQDDSAGQLIFLARTCVMEYAGDSCSTGLKEGSAVTVCISHCMQDGCNAARQAHLPLLTACFFSYRDDGFSQMKPSGKV